MDNIRLNKISRLIQKELSLVFQKHAQSLTGNAMITVTGARVSADLSIARISISIFAPGVAAETVLGKINENKSKIRFELGNSIRKQMRKVPEIIFYIDDSLDKIERIEKLLKGEDPDKELIG